MALRNKHSGGWAGQRDRWRRKERAVGESTKERWLENLCCTTRGRAANIDIDIRVPSERRVYCTLYLSRRRSVILSACNGHGLGFNKHADLVRQARDDSDDENEEWNRLREEAEVARRSGSVPPGEVFLVGAGPGDPGLLTMRAAQVLSRADVVLRDRLISDEILEYINKDARVEYVGKNAGFHTRTQEQIHELLYIFAETGKRVVRLKGGDPFVFGRGGEELEYLEARGIRVHTIPGITASSGICASLGIPFTHRGLADSVQFLTGHSRDGMHRSFDEVAVMAAAGNTTLVVYMGLGTIEELCNTLLASGTCPDTPCAAVERGTTPQQRVVVSTLAKFVGRVHEKGLTSPTLIIIGNVVSLCTEWKLQEVVPSSTASIL